MRSVNYAPEDYDCVVIVTAHSAIDYDDLVDRAEIVVDLRNATGRNGTATESLEVVSVARPATLRGLSPVLSGALGRPRSAPCCLHAAPLRPSIACS